MKNKAIFLFCFASLCSACEVIQEVVQLPENITLPNGLGGNLLQQFDRQGPISTTFDDAVYEVSSLYNFEPSAELYQPLDIQPTAEEGGYRLRSGLYTMNAKSFCLRGYTHGPSRGDGHLYAPLEGKKADFIQLILERYGEKPYIPQQDIQVLLWAIIAGADMTTLGQQYAAVLSELFTTTELLEFQGRDWLTGMAGEQIQRFQQLALDRASPQLRNLLAADQKIRDLVNQNQSYQAIESVAIIAGVAPRSAMIREVSKGRWSYHPAGFFVRFFPNGYPQTRVDVYVPRQGEVIQDYGGNVRLAQNASGAPQEVVFNPATMVATPANQSSQRIGISPVPVTPSPQPANQYAISFLAYPTGKKYIDKDGEVSSSLSGHTFVAFSKNGVVESVRGFSPIIGSLEQGIVNHQTDESYLLRFHDILFCVNVSEHLYQQALEIRKEDYFIIVDDCVSYADDVADLIGLDTPTFVTDPLDFSLPMSFVRYLSRNNAERANTNCPVIRRAEF